MRQDEWSRRVVGAIAEAVRWHRKRRGMSAQQLADECARLGYAVPRSVLTNLENGRRETVSVPEWLVLAAALRVGPLLLVFPVGRFDEIEPLPDVTVSPWDAVKWAETGRMLGIDGGPFQEDAELIGQYRRHEEFVRTWEQSRTSGRQIRERLEMPNEWLVEHDAHPAEIRAELAEAKQREEHAALMVKQVRAALTRAGVHLPPLPPSLAAVVGELEDVT
jgi:transcriptional regulator with XRE-family HTH domain